MSNRDTDSRSIEELANEAPIGLVAEFIELVRYNKKWWMIPFLLLLGLVGLLAVFSGSGAAPFIYPFF